MKIILDCREQRLEAFLKTELEKHNTKSKSPIELEKGNLDIGDAHILDKNDTLLSIIERKTIKDLLSSLRDGRYNEQSFRLNQCELENTKICYLLEGACFPDQRNTVNGCIVSLALNKGFSVLNAKNLEETAKLLIKICEKVDKSGVKTNYTETVTIKKKTQTTTENIDIIMLMQIPNVSLAIATKIFTQYPSLKSLIAALEENPLCLNEMKITNTKGQERRISKTAIKNIVEFLLK